MRVLFLSRWFPYPPDNGAKIRVFNLLRQLSRRFQVSLISFRDGSQPVDRVSPAADRLPGVAITSIPYRPFRPTSVRAVRGIFASQPRFLVDTFNRGFSDAVQRELGKQNYDVVVASQMDTVPYALRAEGVPALFEELELTGYLDAMQSGRPARDRLRAYFTWVKLRSYLRRVLPRFAACTVVSELERMQATAAVPGYDRIHVIPNSIDIEEYRRSYGPVEPNTIVFAGSPTYEPNYDAVRFFLSQIYPLVKKDVPEIDFRVTGSCEGVDLASLPNVDGVTFTGYLPEVHSTVARSWVSVVPLRAGGGTRLKILESMALGTPVVSTSKGAEGLEVSDGQEIVIADNPVEFAAQVVGLLLSPARRARLSVAGREMVAGRYDWGSRGQEVCDLVRQAAGSRRRESKCSLSSPSS